MPPKAFLPLIQGHVEARAPRRTKLLPLKCCFSLGTPSAFAELQVHLRSGCCIEIRTPIGSSSSCSPCHFGQHLLGQRPDCSSVSEKTTCARASSAYVLHISSDRGNSRMAFQPACTRWITAIELGGRLPWTSLRGLIGAPREPQPRGSEELARLSRSSAAATRLQARRSYRHDLRLADNEVAYGELELDFLFWAFLHGVT
jgi:hypothetical protein